MRRFKPQLGDLVEYDNALGVISACEGTRVLITWAAPDAAEKLLGIAFQIKHLWVQRENVKVLNK